MKKEYEAKDEMLNISSSKQRSKSKSRMEQKSTDDKATTVKTKKKKKNTLKKIEKSYDQLDVNFLDVDKIYSLDEILAKIAEI